MKTFLIVDDHVAIRSGLQKFISETFKPCMVEEANDGDSATEKLKQHTYDLVMMDIQMPNTDTLSLVEFIHIKYGSKVLMYSMNSESIYAKRFLKVGAVGFLSKNAPLEEVKKAITLVLSGRKYISDSLAALLMENSISNASGNPFDSLSSREFEIATLLLAGQTVSDISNTLNLQISTIGTHKARMFTKLNVTNLLELKELANSYNM